MGIHAFNVFVNGYSCFESVCLGWLIGDSSDIKVLIVLLAFKGQFIQICSQMIVLFANDCCLFSIPLLIVEMMIVLFH